MSHNNKKAKKPILFWTLTGISALLVTAFSVGYVCTLPVADVINQALNIKSTKNIEVSDSSKEDTKYFKSDYANTNELVKSDADVAERLTEEGSVLLKNENDALPLSKNARVTLLGHTSDNFIVCGTGSAKINADCVPCEEQRGGHFEKEKIDQILGK